MSQTSADTSQAPSLMQMAGPLVVSFWMRAAVTFVDTMFAALLGDAEIAAIGLSVPLEFLMIAIWVGLSTGLTSSLSRAMGAGEGTKVEQYLKSSWKLAAALTPIFTAVGVAIWFGAFHLGLENDVAAAFQIYGAVLIGGAAWTTFWSIIPDSLVKAHQDTKSTMWAGIWSNIVNLLLNALFLFVFEWGIFGIALSTVIGRIAGFVYAWIIANRHEAARHAKGVKSCAPDPHPYRQLMRLAVPASLTFGLMALESGLINALLASMKNSTEAIAAYSIYYRVSMFAVQPLIATSVAMLPFAALRFGSGDMQATRAGFRQATLYALVYSFLIVGPAMYFLARPIGSWLAESPLTAEYARVSLLLVPFGCAAGALFMLCRPVFEAMNRGQPGLVMALFRYIVLTGPLAWAGIWLARSLEQPPLYGLLVGLLLAAIISSVVFYVWLARTLATVAPHARVAG